MSMSYVWNPAFDPWLWMALQALSGMSLAAQDSTVWNRPWVYPGDLSKVGWRNVATLRRKSDAFFIHLCHSRNGWEIWSDTSLLWGTCITAQQIRCLSWTWLALIGSLHPVWSHESLWGVISESWAGVTPEQCWVRQQNKTKQKFALDLVLPRRG